MVFISYRRSDEEGARLAQAIFKPLEGYFGEGKVFLDVKSRKPGQPYPEHLQRALEIIDAVVVAIGSAWLEILRQRLEIAGSVDWVQHEIAVSLARPYLPVLPVLSPGAGFPRKDQLPSDLQKLVEREKMQFLEPFDDKSNFEKLINDVASAIKDAADNYGKRARPRFKAVDEQGFRALEEELRPRLIPGGVEALLDALLTAGPADVRGASDEDLRGSFQRRLDEGLVLGRHLGWLRKEGCVDEDHRLTAEGIAILRRIALTVMVQPDRKRF
jgi:hypothetical protein